MRRLASSVLLLAGVVGAGCERETANRPPVALAGDDRLAFRGDSITLDGSGSFDPDDPDAADALSFAWRQLSGPTTVQGSTTAAFQFDAAGAGAYVFELAVTDDDKAVATDVVAVHVQNVLGVVRTVPDDGAAGVSGRQPVVVFFDAPVRPWTAAASVRLDDVTDPQNPDPVEGNVTLEDDGTAVVFSPVVDWSDLAAYRVTVTTQVMGLDGATLPVEVTSSFTGATVDTLPPTVVSASPGPEGATDVPHSSFVEIVFSEPVDGALLAAAFGLDDGIAPVDGVVTLGAGGTRALFVPADTSGATPDPAPLAASASYVARVADTLTDLSGNALDGDASGAAGGDFTRGFQTVAGADTTAPTILSVSPLRGAQGVSVKLPVVLTFSEPVEPASVELALTLSSSGAAFGGGTIPGVVTMTHGNTVAILQPSANLATGTVYQVRAAATITDLAGNPVPAEFDSFFATGSAPPPTVLQVLPDRGPIDTTLVAQIQGEDFVDGATVFVPGGGVLVDQTTFLSETLLQATLTIAPSAQLGSRPITVTNPDGQQDTGLSLFEILEPPPSIASLSPAAANLGQTGVPISVLGAGFQNGATVSISGAGVTVDSVAFVDDGQLDLLVTVAGGAATGARNVTVTNPDQQAATLTNGFTVRLLAPTVTGVVPGSGGQGENLFSVVINGTEFQTAPFPTVDMGTGVLASTVAATSTNMTVNISIAGTAPLGAHDVKVTNGDGQSFTLTGGFTVVFAPPTIIGSTPSAPQGETTAVTFNGTNFQCSGPNGGPTVEVLQGGLASAGITEDNTLAGLSACNATSFTRSVNVDAAAGATVGLHDLRVTNPDGQFRDGANTFRVLEERPVITAVQDSLGAPLTLVSRKASYSNAKIIGDFFQSGATVFLGAGINVTSLIFVSANELQASFNVDAVAALGPVDVIVSNPDALQGLNGSVLSVREAAPSIGALSISQANQDSVNPSVTLLGNDFQCGPDPDVTFSGSGVTASVTGCAPSSLTLTVTVTDTAALGGRTVTVQNADLQQTTSAGTVLTVLEEAPTVTGLQDSLGVALTLVSRKGAYTDAKVIGTFFQPGATVAMGSGPGFAGVTVSSVTFVSATELRASFSVAAGADLGDLTIRVTNPDTQQGENSTFADVREPAPTVGALSITQVNQAASVPGVMLAGADFQCGPDPSVTFDGTLVTAAVTACAPGQLTLTIAATDSALLTGRTVTVQNADGQATTSAGTVLTVVEEAPTVTALQDSLGAALPLVSRKGAYTDAKVIGTFFQTGATVAMGSGPGFAGVTVSSVTFVSATELRASFSVAAGADLGDLTIRVTNPDTQQAENSTFSDVREPAPTVGALSIAQVNQAASVPGVTLAGVDFQCGPDPTVTFSGTLVTAAVTSCAPGQLTLTVSATDAAPLTGRTVTVQNADGQATTSAGTVLTVIEEAPTVTALQDSFGAALPLVSRKGAYTDAKVVGTFFQSGATVAMGSGVSFAGVTVSSVTFVSATELRVSFSVAAAADLGDLTIRVVNPDTQQVENSTLTDVREPAPTLGALSISQVNQAANVPSVTLAGVDFQCGPDPTVTFSGTFVTAAVTACAPGQLTLTVSATDAAALTGRTVTVQNADGQSTTSAGNVLTVIEEAPTVSALQDSLGAALPLVSRKGAYTDAKIIGTFFQSGATVAMGSGPGFAGVTVSSVTFVNATELRVSFSVAAAADLGDLTIRVVNPDTQQVENSTLADVREPAPTVGALSISQVNQAASVPSVTLAGVDFQCGPDPVVTFSGTLVTAAVTACVPGQLTMTVSATDSALLTARTVTVQNADGQATTSSGTVLTVIEEAPVITALQDSLGAALPLVSRKGAYTDAKIIGTFFQSGATVAMGSGGGFAGLTVSSVTFVSASELRVSFFVDAAADLGDLTIRVVNPDTQQAENSTVTDVREPAPTVGALSISQVNQAATVPGVTLAGLDFQCGPDPAVTFSGTLVTAAVTACTPGELTLTVGATDSAALTGRTVTVQNADGQATTSAGTVVTVIEEAPTVTALQDSLGAALPLVSRKGAYTDTKIIGTFFQSGATVAMGSGPGFSGVTVSSVTFVSATELRASFSVAAAADLGDLTIRVVNPDSQQAENSTFTDVREPAPTLGALSISTVNQAATVPSVTLTGEDFQCGPDPAVTFSGTLVTATVTACAPAQLTLTVAATDSAALTARTVTVQNADGQATTSAATVLTVIEEAPTVTALQDSLGAALPLISRKGAYADAKVIGTFFQTGATVAMGSGLGFSGVTISSLTFVSATELRVSFSVAATADLGDLTIRVVNPDSQQAENSTFTDVREPAPTIGALSISEVNQAASVPNVTLAGADFQCGPDPTVTFSGTLVTAAVTACAPAQLTLTVSATDLALLTGRTVTVQNADGQETTSAGVVLTVIEEAPVLTALRDSLGAPLTQVSAKGSYSNAQLIGSFFQNGATVSMGLDISITTLTFVNGTNLQLSFSVSDSPGIGPATVIVTNPDFQQDSDAGIVSIRQAAPSITGVTPAEGNRGSIYSGVNAIEVSGVDFDCAAPGPTVVIGDDVTATVSTCTPTLLSVDVDLTGSQVELKDVTVTNPDLQSQTRNGFFEVLAEKPVVTSVVTTPASGPPSNGRRGDTLQVEVTGSFFQATPTVSFGAGISVTGVFFGSASSLTVDLTIAPGATLGLRDVAVTNPDTQVGSASGAFEVLRAVPLVVGIAPSEESKREPMFVATITGDHFDCTGVPPDVEIAAGITVVNESCGAGTSDRETTITAEVTVTDTATAGTKSVSVTNAGDSSSGLGVGLFVVKAEKPVISSVSSSIKQGEELVVSVVGSPLGFFQPGAVVTVPGGQATVVGATGFVTSNELTVTLDVPPTTAAGTYLLRVTNPDGQVDEETILVIAEADAPTITGVCNSGGVPCGPAWADQGGTRRIVISGAGFQDSFSVAIGGAADVPHAVVSNNGTTITIDVSPDIAASLTLRDLVVTNTSSNPNKNTGATGNGMLQITEAAPTVSTLTPASGVQGASLTGVVIDGTNFRIGATVTFSGTGVSAVVTNVDEALDEITCDITIAPSALAVFRDVTVVNSDGSRTTKASGFEVQPAPGAPLITSVERDPSRAGDAFLNDDRFSIRQGETALFHVIGSNFDDQASVLVSGPGVTVSGTTVFAGGSRIDFTLAVDCTDLAPGKRDVTVINPGAPDGNGLNGTEVDGIHVRRGVVINEVATADRTDRFGNGGGGGVRETLEIFNGSGCPWDLTNWRLDFLDTDYTGYEMGLRATSERFSAGSSLSSLLPGGYVVIQRPDGNADDMEDEIFLSLFTNTGRYIDHVEIGDDEENDGNDGGPAVGNDGGNTSVLDEMVARCPNGSSTDDLSGSDNDVADFYQNELAAFLQGATPFGTGAVTAGFAVADGSNNAECPPCADGADLDGDGWVDMLDAGCTDPHTDADGEGLGAEGTAQCNDGLDNDGMSDGIDAADPDCFSGADSDESI